MTIDEGRKPEGAPERYNETWLVARHGYKTPAQVRAEQTTPQPAIDQPIDQALSLAA